jgi:hypothetical protein
MAIGNGRWLVQLTCVPVCMLTKFRHKKRRPWTSFICLVGRGNLNQYCKWLIWLDFYIVNNFMEYFLEYQFDPRCFEA